jgi:acyl transferase domain-containing protein
MIRRKTIWLFSGQGSQYFGMGRSLFESEAVFREAFMACARHLGGAEAAALEAVVYGPRADRLAPFDNLRQSHVALFATQWATAAWLRSRGVSCDAVGGYSLGETVAAVVAGALSWEAGLDLVRGQAELAAGSVAGGRMSALLGDGVEDWAEAQHSVWIAARNFPGHLVLAGEAPAMRQVEQRARAGGFSVHPLPVPVAFHCPLVDALGPPFKQRLEETRASPMSVPVWSASRGWVESGWQLEQLWRAVRTPIDLPSALREAEARGPWRYLDCGPAGTLAGFIERTLHGLGSASVAQATLTPFGRETERLRSLDP